MNKVSKRYKNNRFLFVTAIGVFVTWLLVLVFIDILVFLHRDSGLETLEGILYFIAILFFLGIGWAIYIGFYLLENIVPVRKGDSSKDSATVKITE